MESKIYQKITAGILTVSDKGSRGEREDLSGLEIRKLLETLPAEVLHYEIIPDEADIIADRLIHLADVRHLDLILTTGGTGVSPRDVTPEATLRVIEKEIPGLAELMRLKSLEITPHAALSRAVAGIRGCSLIVNLPGSPKSVRENLAVILPTFRHAVEKIKGDPSDCAAQ
ncbi:MAG: molybdopterin adenylyltransferase [Syntrophaceae bacterium]